MRKLLFLILSLFIIKVGLGQDLNILPEHEFFEVLSGVHPYQNTFHDSTPKYNDQGDLLSDPIEIIIENKVIVQRGILFIDNFKGRADSTFASSIDYLKRSDTINLQEKNNKVYQRRNITVKNCVFYDLKIEQFEFEKIQFINCTFKDGLSFIGVNASYFFVGIDATYTQRNSIKLSKPPTYSFRNCLFGDFDFNPLHIGSIKIGRTITGKFNLYSLATEFSSPYSYFPQNPLSIDLDSTVIKGSSCIFSTNIGEPTSILPPGISLTYSLTRSSIQVGFDTLIKSLTDINLCRFGVNPRSNFTLENVYITGNNKRLPIELLGDLNKLHIDSSVFELPFVYNNSEIASELEIHETVFDQVSLSKTIFPSNPYNVSINWGQVKGELALIRPGKWSITQEGTIDTNALYPYVFQPPFKSDSGSIKEYNELLAIHENFMRLYDSRGDKLAMNACHVSLKNLETEKIRFLKKHNRGSITKLFQLRFNQLFYFTSDYGTNPLKVFFNMFWVIVFFAFLFLLLPNNIDTSTAKPLGKIIITVWFAFDQSLRGFLTFGSSQNDIPIARFFSLLLGLIGWLHLVLFVVTLLYQALL